MPKKYTHQDFLDRTERQGDCVVFVGRRDKDDYGVFRKEGAHRYSYSYFVGEIPEGMLVRHTCDNPPCVLPSHLRLGTTQDNVNDKMKRGRHKGNKLDRCGVCGGEWSYYDAKARGNVCRPCRNKSNKEYKERKRNEDDENY